MILFLFKFYKRRMNKLLFKFFRCFGCCRGWLEKFRVGCSDCEKLVGYRECESEFFFFLLFREVKKYVY